MPVQLTKKEARDTDFLTLKSKSTGEIVRIISPHDFYVGIEGLKASDVRVVGDVHVTGSLYVKGGVSGSLKLPDGSLAITAGSGISVTETGAGGVEIATTGGGSGGAPDNASYVVITSNGDLTSERVLAGTADRITITDNGANSTVVIDVGSDVYVVGGSDVSLSDGGTGASDAATARSNLGVTATGADTTYAFRANNLSDLGSASTARTNLGLGTIATQNSNNVSITGGVIQVTNITGSLTKLTTGNDYLRAGTNVTLTTGSDGSVTIAAPSVGGAPTDADYLVVGSTSAGSLSNERTLTIGSGLFATDGGSGGSYTLKVLDSAVAFLTGAEFSGPVTASNLRSTNLVSTRLSGSLTRLSNGDPYLVAGSNITITTGSSGAVTIAGSGLVGNTSPFLLHSGDASLPQALVLTHGAGIDIIEDGFGNFVVVADLVEGNNITITELPGGELEISADVSAAADPDAQYLVLSATGSLTNERVFTAGTGIKVNDAGSGGNFTVSVRDDVVATISGSTFTGPAKFQQGLSGSLTSLSNGNPYLVAGNSISLVTGSGGEITISSTAAGADAGASYLVLSTTSSLSNERAFTPGTGLFATDGGASSSYTLSISDSVVATVSGSTFTGPVKFEQGLSGSLTTLSDGTPYLIAGSNVTIATGSSGAVTISSTAGVTTQLSLAEIPGGTVDGSNKTFTLANAPSPSSSLMLFYNGLLLSQGSGYDYTLASTTVTFEPAVDAPDTGSSLLALYSYAPAVAVIRYYTLMEAVSFSLVGPSYEAVLVDAPSPSSSVMLFMNGQLLKQGVAEDFTVSGDTLTLNFTEFVSESSFYATYERAS